jgi:predicted NBD/HSP70 family sugar kinase
MTTPGTPTWLRTHNDRAAFRLFLEHGPLSRKQLGDLSGLSKPTASQMILRLERVGLIAPAGETSGSRGPNAVSYGVRHDSMTGVAISILGDSIEAVLVDPTDAEHPVVELPFAELAASGVVRSPVTDVRAAVDAACRAAGVASSSVTVVAVGVQAAVDTTADALSFTDTLPGWPHHGARAAIERDTGLSVILDNDVNLATMAERATAEARDLASFAYVWLGEGLGVGTDVEGVVQRGATGSAGEVGYLEVPRSAIALDPDAYDFTDLLGGPAVRRLLGAEPDARLRDVLSSLPEDERSLGALADRVALLVSPIIAVLDPSTIVVGGPTGHAGGDDLARRVQERIAHEPHPKADPAQGATHHRVEVRASAAGPQPILRGARRRLVDTIRDRLTAGIAVDPGSEA